MITAALPMMLVPAGGSALAEPPAPGTIAPFDALLAALAPPLPPAPCAVRSVAGDAAISIDGETLAGAAERPDDEDVAKDEPLPVAAVPDAAAPPAAVASVTLPTPLMVPASDTPAVAKPVSVANEPRSLPAVPLPAADRRPLAAGPAATAAPDTAGEGQRTRVTDEAVPAPAGSRAAARRSASPPAERMSADSGPRAPGQPIAAMPPKSLPADVRPRVTPPSIGSQVAEPTAADAGPPVLAAPIASAPAGPFPGDVGPHVLAQPIAPLAAEPAPPGLATPDRSPAAAGAGHAIGPAIATPRVLTITLPTDLAAELASATALTPPIDAFASIPREARLAGAGRTPAPALPAVPVADAVAQGSVPSASPEVAADGLVSRPPAADVCAGDPIAADRAPENVTVADMPVAVQARDSSDGQQAAYASKADIAEPGVPTAGRADAAAIVRTALAAAAPALDRVAIFPRFSGGAAVASVRAPAATRSANSPREADADVSGLDLDAIFPLAGNAPLTVAFVRPAAASVPQRPADAPATPAAAADPAAPERQGIDRGAPDAARSAMVTAALPPIAPAPVRADGAGAVQAPAIPAEISVQHHLDVAHDGIWLDRLARDIAASADHESRIRFQLNPERLGALQVEIKPGTDGASVRFTADSEMARTLIVDAQPKLIADARAHGMKIADTQVAVSGQQSGGYGQGGGGGGGLAQQQQSGGQRPPLFDRPAAAMTRPAPARPADQSAARAERYA